MNKNSKLKIKNSNLRLVFMGSPKIGATVLSGLIKSDVNFDSIITMPDRPKGRSKKPEMTEVKKTAMANKIKVYEPNSKDKLTETIEKIKPDLCIIAAYGMIIPKEALDIPKYGMINFHPSLLPLYRGPTPIAIPIMCDDKKTGVTIIQISEKMDAGDILAQEEYKLDGTETTPELSEKLAHIGTKMISNLLPDIEKGKTKPKKQDDSKATYTEMITKDQGKIDWKLLDAKGIEQMFRAFTPWPGIYSYWNDKKIDFYNISVLDPKKVGPFLSEKGPTFLLKPGEVTEKDGKILIGTKEGTIAPKYLKLEGKNKVTAEEFVRGYPKFINSVLKSQL